MIPARPWDRASRPTTSIQLRGLGTYAFGGLVGGLVGGAFVVVVTSAAQADVGLPSGQATWVLIVVPLVGLGLALLVLHGLGRSEGSRAASAWRTFPPGAVRADLTGDIVDTAGQEERFPWRLAAIRLTGHFRDCRLGRRHGDRVACGVPRYRRRAPGSGIADDAGASSSVPLP